MDTASTLGTALNVGRIAFGLAAVVAPTKAAEGWIGRAAAKRSVHPMTRAFGIRDVALGAATIGALQSSGPSGVGTRILLGLGVMVDTVDAVSGRLSKDDVPNVSLIYAVAGSAAATGAIALAAASSDDVDEAGPVTPRR